ncbi:MAG: DUF504 domain-containing protein [Thermoplasmatota archaeon]
MIEGTARDVLLKQKWSGGGLSDIIIEYLDRGSPGDVGIIAGSDVDHIGRSFVELLDGTKIPFHRLMRIKEMDILIWERKVKTAR